MAQIAPEAGPEIAYGNYNMGNIRSRFSVLAAIFVAALGGWPTPAQALVLDWGTATWSNAGMLNGAISNSYDLNADAINDITVALTPQDQATWAADPTTGMPTPVVNQSLTGGVSPWENSLNLSANLKTQSNVWIRISFTGAQPGADNVSFTIFDIDITTNADIIESIVGRALDGSFVPATITNVGSTVSHTGTGFGQQLTGNGAAANHSSHGNATISFGSTIITDVFFNFSNSSGTHQFQDIAIGDISFTPVPEMNPAATAAGSCIAAMVFTVLLQRRARRARRMVPKTTAF
jgi:hypothetical protein